MNYKENCSYCNRELILKRAKGDNIPDKIVCKACYKSPPEKVIMNLGDALKVAKKKYMQGRR